MKVKKDLEKIKSKFPNAGQTFTWKDLEDLGIELSCQWYRQRQPKYLKVVGRDKQLKKIYQLTDIETKVNFNYHLKKKPRPEWSMMNEGC